MPRPDAPTLYAWSRRWQAIQRAAYAELVAGYTPEQREVIRRMTEAKRQRRLCRERARWPAGSQGTHPSEMRLAGGAAGRVAAKPRPARRGVLLLQRVLKLVILGA